MGLSKLKAEHRQSTRLLANPQTTPDLRQKTERKLRALQLEIDVLTQKSAEQTIAEKYRMVKFFEKKKLARRLKAAQKSGDKTLEDKCKRALKYIDDFPKDRKYVALFHKNEEEAEGEGDDFTIPDVKEIPAPKKATKISGAPILVTASTSASKQAIIGGKKDKTNKKEKTDQKDKKDKNLSISSSTKETVKPSSRPNPLPVKETSKTQKPASSSSSGSSDSDQMVSD